MGMISSSVGRYLRYSIGATALVVALPLLGVGFLYSVAKNEAGWAVAALVAAGVCVVAALGGAMLWKRRPESADVSFGELMLWRFFFRVRAEERLNESAHALGLDSGGRPLRRTQMSAAERLKTLRTLAKALESKDPYTHGHSHRVEVLAARTAIELDLSSREIQELRTAAALHDVGKIRVPTRILRKPDRLTVEEKLIVQEHSTVGAWMVSGVSNRRIVMSVRHHHERWDGNGYPDGVEGREIPLFARIISVADSFDAMTSNRPYRDGFSREQAIDELRDEAGRQFDPVVVDAFLEAVPHHITVPGFFGPGIAAAIVRRFLRWTRRLVTTQTAQTVAGAGIAAVVASSVFIPPAAVPSEASTTRSGGSHVTTASNDDRVEGLVVRRSSDNLARHNRGKATVERSTHRVAAASLKIDGTTPEGTGGGSDTSSAPSAPRGSNGHHEPAAPPSRDKNPPDVSKPAHPQPPGDAGPPDGDDGGDDGGDSGEEDHDKVKKEHSDPHPENGRDCQDHPGKGGGGGNAKHCDS